MKKKFFWFACNLLMFCGLYAKQPDISPRDVRFKLNEVLRAHVTQKNFSEEIIKRGILNYLEEFDPTKTYFIASDIEPFINPTPEFIYKVQSQIVVGNYEVFTKIHDIFIEAIHRRNELEKVLETLQDIPVSKLSFEETNEIDWAKNEEELYERLIETKSIQLTAAQKLKDESAEQFISRIKKRRINKENQILENDNQEAQKLVLVNVLKAFTAALDSHTNYFTPSEASQFMIQVQQRLFGIGVQLKDNLNGFSVARILEGGPAFQTHELKINDLIIAVDHEPIVGMDILEAVELIRGEKGTKLTLTVLREKEDQTMETHEIELVRGEVVLEETRLENNIEPYADGVIAHLRLFSFYQDSSTSSAKDIYKALKKVMNESNLKGVILDLRNNSGGLLPQAVAVSGLFMNRGIVVSIKDSTGKIQHLRNTEDHVLWDGPLIILTNRASASAAEIVAQNLQDYGRALVIGDNRTFGKGTFQTFTLDASNPEKVNPQGEFKVTRGKYYTVSGKSPQLVGVKPDIVVPGILSTMDIGEEFAKFPLENDAIEPNFDDTLSDIPYVHRTEVAKIYHHNLQTKLATYQPFIDILQSNSSSRINANVMYQEFLEEIKQKRFDSDVFDLFAKNDFQLTESFNIIKDLIFLMQNPSYSH